MKLYRFDRDVSQSITQYGSRELLMSRLARAGTETRVDVMHIGPSGLVGGHQAAANQIFAVIQGSGWVRAGHGPLTPIAAGQAAFWTSGEWHESGSDEGMLVIVIEGESIDPDSLMPEIQHG